MLKFDGKHQRTNVIVEIFLLQMLTTFYNHPNLTVGYCFQTEHEVI